MAMLHSFLPAAAPVVVVVGLLMYRNPLETSHSALYLLGSVAVCFAIIYLAITDFSPLSQSPSSKEGEEAVTDLVTKFRLEVAEVKESSSLLAAIKKRVSGSEATHAKAAKEAFDLGLLKHLLVFLQQLETTDRRILTACDIVNALLSQQAIRDDILANESLLKETTDSVLQTIKEMSSLPPAPARVEEIEDENEVDLLPPPKVKPNEHFSAFGYKFIMSVVSLCMDSLVGQNVMGDRGAIPIILDVFRTYGPTSSEISKWCSAALFNIAFEHPPNKRECYSKGGLVLAIDALKQHSKSAQVHQQCLALIVAILQIDPHTKMNQSKARQTALAANIVDALQSAKKEFKGHTTITQMMDQIDQILITDWS